MPTGRNMPSANITHSQSESIAVSSYPSMPSTTEDQPESNSSARLARSGAEPEKSGSRHKPPPAKRDAQECETLQKVPRRRGAARKDKLLESPNFLCELALFHLAAGQPCVMRWQNSETALRPLHARSWSDPEKGRGGRRTGREGMVSDVIRRAWQACRRTALAAVLTAIALPLACPPSRAAYPERVITLIVPFPAGGPTDIIARIVSLALQKSLGQSVIVDNRGGGGGNPGMGIAARAPPDGYTLLLTSTAIAVNPALYNNLPYDPLKDFAPICELVNAPNVLFVRSDSGIRSVADPIARAKAAPGALNYSSPGAGTKSHLTAEQLKLRAGIDMVHIPYRGGGPATMAVLEGTVDVGSVALAPVEPLIKEGKFTALAVTGAERWFTLPEVPTMIEQGFPGFVSDTFNALFAPAGTPPEIVALLSKASRAALATPEAREQAHRAGYQIVGGTPEQLAARLASEIPAVKELVSRLGIKPQ